MKPLVGVTQIVEKGEIIGKINKIRPVHLHYEIIEKEELEARFGKSNPGKPFNYADLDFDPNLFANQENKPDVEGIFLHKKTPSNPRISKAIPYPGSPNINFRKRNFHFLGGDTVESQVYVIARVIDRESGSRLFPREVKFSTPENPIGQTLRFDSEKDALITFDTSNLNGPGVVPHYSRKGNGQRTYAHGVFDFWFLWSLGSDSDDPSSPRSFYIDAEDMSGEIMAREKFTFGPKIILLNSTAYSHGESYSFGIAANAGPFPNIDRHSSGALDHILLKLQSNVNVLGSIAISITHDGKPIGLKLGDGSYKIPVLEHNQIFKVTLNAVENKKPPEGFESLNAIASSEKMPSIKQNTSLSGGERKETAFELEFIPKGAFTMGAPLAESRTVFDDEPPVSEWSEKPHTVTFTRSFLMGNIETTNDQMIDVMNWALVEGLLSANSNSVSNREGDSQELIDLDNQHCQISYSDGSFVVDSGKGSYPCITVNWYGAMAFCNYLTRKEGGLIQAVDLSNWSIDFTKEGYRLPTEAEWEYACRATTTTAFYTGAFSGRFNSILPEPNLELAGWYAHNFGIHNPDIAGTNIGALKQANAWGLFDMHGNVREWCWDWFIKDISAEATDPTGPVSGNRRMFRGGHFGGRAVECRSAHRDSGSPGSTIRGGGIGFRIVRNSSL